MKKIKEKGITLVALIVTIIILLVLAGITIGQLTENGIFENAKMAKEKYSNMQEQEEDLIGKAENEINKYVNGSSREETVTLSKSDYDNLINRLSAVENSINGENGILSQIETLQSASTPVLTESGSYVGNGTKGSSNKNTITFSKAPKVVIVSQVDVNTGDDCVGSQMFIQGCKYSISSGELIDGRDINWYYTQIASWTNSGKTLSWYGVVDAEVDQLNINNVTYNWVAIY